MKQQMSKEKLQKYFDKLEIKVKKAEKIEHEEALSSSIYKLTKEDGSNLILKISYNKKRWLRECCFLEQVKDHILVPKVIDVISPSDEFEGAILLEFLSGELISFKSLDDEIAFQMGKLLAKVHNIPCQFYGDIANKEILPPTISSGVFLLKDYYEKAFNECKNHLDLLLLKKIEKYFDKEIEEVKSLDGPCVVHRDFKPGNIFVKNKQIIGLIDWEIAKNSFAEEDFSKMQYLVWDDYPKTKNAFLNGYKTIRNLSNFERIMPLLRVCKALGSIGFTIDRNAHNTRHKYVFDLNLIFLQQFFLHN